ncbi:MAG: lysophospholipid acyltransferase family protein [Myxococcota bacterium]
MSVGPDVLAGISPADLQQLLPVFLASQVAGQSAPHVAELVSHWSESEYTSLLGTLRALGQEHRVYPAVPHCRALARAWMSEILTTRVEHVDRLRSSMDEGRTVIVTNHVSYVDAVATDVALFTSGNPDLADRIVYLAGPKVYQELFRLVAAASIHSLPVPQSNQVSHTENLAVRELARRAMSSLEAGKSALDEGFALLFYPEGSRTRSGRLEPFLKATRRYLQAGDLVVPAVVLGTERAMPLDAPQMVPSPVSLVFGEPIRVESCESARDLLSEAHAAVSAMLPEPQRALAESPALL